MDFKICGHYFQRQNVRLMENLPSGVLFRRRLWIKHVIVLNLREISCDITVSAGGNSGSTTLKLTVTLKVLAVIDYMNVYNAIEDMYMEGFIKDQEKEEMLRYLQRLRDVIWKHREIFKGTGCVMVYKQKIELVPKDSPVAVPIRRRSPVEQKIELYTVKIFLKVRIMEAA